MSSFRHGDADIHFDDEGAGFPALLIAPGGMRSANELWRNMPWNARALADTYRVIGMDQRNAGRSTAPISANDGWATYTEDQLALLDRLDIDRCHVVGMCIGGPYIAGLLQLAPERFASAVMLQPVGIDDNRAALEEMFDQWAASQAPSDPDVDDATWAAFRTDMWGGDFLLTASPDDVERFRAPILLLMGDDLYHPRSTSLEIAARAPDVTVVERWKDDDVLAETDRTIRGFLATRTPT